VVAVPLPLSKLSQVVRKPLFPFQAGRSPRLTRRDSGDSAQVFGSSVFLVGSAVPVVTTKHRLFIAGASFPELSGGGFESWISLLLGTASFMCSFCCLRLSFEILRIQPPAACRA